MKMHKTNTPVVCTIQVGHYGETVTYEGYPIAPRQHCNAKGCETLTLNCLNCRYNRVDAHAHHLGSSEIDNPILWLQRHTLCCYEWQRGQDKAEIKRQLADERKQRRK